MDYQMRSYGKRMQLSMHSKGTKITKRHSDYRNSKSLRNFVSEALILWSLPDYFFYQRLPLSRWNEPLSVFSLALETDIVLPSACVPSSSRIAFSAASSAISTKAKPLDLPVSLSEITFAEVTSPYWANIDRNSSLVTWKPRFDTYMFMINKLTN